MRFVVVALVVVAAALLAGCTQQASQGNHTTPSVKDCGTVTNYSQSDSALICFQQAAINCELAKVKLDYSPVYRSGTEQVLYRIITAEEIKGGSTSACSFYGKIDRMVLSNAVLTTAEQKQLQNASQLIGKEMTCNLTSAEIYALLTESLSAEEMCSKCSGTLVDFVKSLGACSAKIVSGFNKARVLDHVVDASGTSLIIGNFAGKTLKNVTVLVNGSMASPTGADILTSGSAIFKSPAPTCINSCYDLLITVNFVLDSTAHTETGTVRGSCGDCVPTPSQTPPSYVAPPASIDYTQQKFAVVNCYTSSGALDIRSESGFTLNDLNFSVINAANGSTLCDGAYIIDTIQPSETKQIANNTACPVTTSTQYTLRSRQGIPDVGFTCKGGGGGGTIAQQHCNPGFCYSGGHCCPYSARYYCNGNCYSSTSDMYNAGCSVSSITVYC
jgi:hypothetical protein